MGLDPLTVVIAAATWVVALGTVLLMWWQLSQQRELNSAATILNLRDRYDAEPLRSARRRLSRSLLDALDPSPGDIEVCRFLELVGFLTHRRVLDRRMVWNAFGGWVTSYYYLLTHPTDRIAEWRREFHDPMVFAEFEWLDREMEKLDLELSGPHSNQTRAEDSRGVLENESTMSAPRP